MILFVDSAYSDGAEKGKVRQALLAHGVTLPVRFATSELEAVQCLECNKPFAVFVGAHVGLFSGSNFVGEILDVHPDVPVVMLSVDAGENARGSEFGAMHSFEKVCAEMCMYIKALQ